MTTILLSKPGLVRSSVSLALALGLGACAVDSELDTESAPDLAETRAELGGFDWGSKCDGGNGAFQQPIPHGQVVAIGEIPGNKQNVRIELTSAADVDIQLIDVVTGKELIGWPNGILNGAGQSCGTFEGVSFCYSGYNGGQTAGTYGNEWIEVNGPTARRLQMRAFGYAAGNASVTYRWEALPNCMDAGAGTFTQPIAKDATVTVGVIPTGKRDVRITLRSDRDVDIQLYDGAIPLVQWPNGRLNGAGKQILDYVGTTIAYSGYSGIDGLAGHELIEVRGKVTRELTMLAFGYAAGNATVDYSWGCPANGTVHGDECLCDPGFAGKTDGAFACVACPAGAQCDTAGTLWDTMETLPGWWGTPTTPQ